MVVQQHRGEPLHHEKCKKKVVADEIPPAAPCNDVRQRPLAPDPWMGDARPKRNAGEAKAHQCWFVVDSITRRIFDAKKKDTGTLLAEGDEDGPCNAQDLEPGFFALLRSSRRNRRRGGSLRYPDSRRRWMGEIDVTSWPCPRVYARIYYTGLDTAASAASIDHI